jgi:hypothetical protein
MNKIQSFKLDIAEKLIEIEDRCKAWGLPITKLTMIARDPNNDKMLVVLTNEDRAGLQQATALALNEDTTAVAG